MDESKEYEVMCRASKEIQEIAYETDLRFGNRFDLDANYYPTQYRLQEIYCEWAFGKDYKVVGNKAAAILDPFSEFVLESDDCPVSAHGSMEQLWLHFVMLRVYGKKWVDGEWILND